MTKIWGPLGWMALHSVSINYPETPTQDEINLASRFLDLFGDTISCPSCQFHFKKMLSIYRQKYPYFLNSRQEFALFGFRAHNTVSKRLDKPRPQTMTDCIKTLKSNCVNTSLAGFRQIYLNYLLRNWGDSSPDSRFIKRHVQDMQKVNTEYWDKHETNLETLVLEEADVLEFITDETIKFVAQNIYKNVKVGFIKGKLKFGNR